MTKTIPPIHRNEGIKRAFTTTIPTTSGARNNVANAGKIPDSSMNPATISVTLTIWKMPDAQNACVNGTIKRTALFDTNTQGWYWDYNNVGLRVAQLRFYPGVQTTVPAGGTAC